MLSVLMSSESAAASQHCPGAQEKDGCWIPRYEPSSRRLRVLCDWREEGGQSHIGQQW